MLADVLPWACCVSTLWACPWLVWCQHVAVYQQCNQAFSFLVCRNMRLPVIPFACRLSVAWCHAMRLLYSSLASCPLLICCHMLMSPTSFQTCWLRCHVLLSAGVEKSHICCFTALHARVMAAVVSQPAVCQPLIGGCHYILLFSGIAFVVFAWDAAIFCAGVLSHAAVCQHCRPCVG